MKKKIEQWETWMPEMPEKSVPVQNSNNCTALSLSSEICPIKVKIWGYFLSLYKWFFFHSLKLVMPEGKVWAGFSDVNILKQ